MARPGIGDDGWCQRAAAVLGLLGVAGCHALFSHDPPEPPATIDAALVDRANPERVVGDRNAEHRPSDRPTEPPFWCETSPPKADSALKLPDGPKPEGPITPDAGKAPDAPKPPDGGKPPDSVKPKDGVKPPDAPKPKDGVEPELDVLKPDLAKDGGAIPTWKAVQPAAPAGNYLGVWGRDATTIVAVGQNCLIAVREGGSWTTLQKPSGCAYELHAVWGSGNIFFAVGANGQIVKITLGSPHVATPVSIPGGALLWSIWGTSTSDLLAVGDGGVVLSSALAWTSTSIGIGVGNNLRDIWAAGPSGLQIAAGKNSAGGPALFTRSPISTVIWSPASISGICPSTAVLRSTYGTSASDVVVVGDQGSILWYHTNQWADARRATVANTTILHGLWASGPTDYVAVGTTASNACGSTNASGAARIYRFSPSANVATDQSPAGAGPLCAVWGTSATNVYAVGHGGTVFRYSP